MKRLSPSDSASAEPARLGAELRDARLALGLSIDDLSQSLRIRRVYLAALEEGRVRDLPAPAYAVGFVRTYARSLGLDEADVVRRFREASGPTVARKTDLVFPEPVPDRGVPAGAVMLVGVVLAVGAYIGWYQWSGSGSRTVDAVPPPPAAIEQALREGSPPETPPDPAPANPANANAAPVAAVPARPVAGGPATPPVAAPAAPPAAEGRILLRAKSDVWVQVRDRSGAQPLVKRVLRAGESVPVPDQPGLLFSTSNIGAVDILVDGAPAAGFVPGAPARQNVALDPNRLKAERIAAPPKPKPANPADAAYVPPGERR